MTLTPPKLLGPKSASSRVVESVEAEIVGEQAASLGRAGRRLADALAALAAANTEPAAGGGRAGDRPALLAAARDAFWALTVQREACGLRNSEAVIAAYGVPAEVTVGTVVPRTVWRRRPRGW